MKPLEKLRKKVQLNDKKMVLLLKKRMELTKKIGKKKKALGLPLKDPAVERSVIRNALRSGKALGLSPSFIGSVIRTVISESGLLQESIYHTGKGKAGHSTEVVNIASSRYLPPPWEFKSAIPLLLKDARTVRSFRNDIQRILRGNDDRAIIIMGPCSIHDIAQAKEYAKRMGDLKKKVHDRFLLVMRTYFEKSRTGRGWTGFFTDPHLDGSGNMYDGISMTRKFLNDMARLGIPAAAEFINPLTPQYIGDQISWAAIGARTSGSQVHRAMASGLCMPVGFKNGTDGNISIAIEACVSASSGHNFLGVDGSGNIRGFKTRGNKHCHLILRGGERPNYDQQSILRVQKAMRAAKLRPNLMIDCSHGNSGKLARNQIKVFKDVIGQISKGNKNIIGIMLESHLNSGKQKLPERLVGFEPSKLRYGVSVTDECLGWDATENMVLDAYERSSGLKVSAASEKKRGAADIFLEI